MKLKLSISKSFLLAFLVAAPIAVNAVSCGDALPAGTTTLVDSDDLSNCDCRRPGFALTITGPDMTLDLGGQTVGCNSQTGFAIFVRGNGNTVRDGSISGGSAGIRLDGGGHTVTNVTVSGADYGFGIDCVESTLTSNTVTGSNSDGISVSSDAAGNTFTCNTVSDNGRFGFFVAKSYDNTFTSNTFTSNTASNNGRFDFDDPTPEGNDGCTASTYDGNAFGTSNPACILEDTGLGASDPVCSIPPTSSPTSSPTPPPTGASDGSGQGDPHFKAWRGQHYDFMGACDLVFLQSEEFESGMGLDVHIRTKIRRDMSYISSAVLRIGADVLEVQSQGVYYLNGAAKVELPSEFSGFEFLHTQPTDKQHVFEVHMGGRERIKLKTYKDFVSVVIEQGLSKHFGKSVGLMGDFGMGHMIARDGKTVLDDPNAFGQEWQVLDTEPTLFQTVRFPQHPQKCTMPTPKTTDMLRRRLLETSSVDELAAEKACEHWGEQGKDDCVFDVLRTGDLEMAKVGAY
jgi:parallel beta-helix repeat protein